MTSPIQYQHALQSSQLDCSEKTSELHSHPRDILRRTHILAPAISDRPDQTLHKVKEAP